MCNTQIEQKAKYAFYMGILKLIDKIKFFWSIARMDWWTRWLRRARWVHSVWLSTCRVWSLNQKVMVFLAARRAGTPLRRHSLAWKNREGRWRGREGKLGHVFVDPHRSSPKTGWDSSPLSVFPISMAFSCCSWWCRPVWCSAARLDARKKRKRSGIAVVVVVIPFTLIVCKGNP